MIGIETLDAIAVRWAKMFEAAVLVSAVEVLALVVRTVMPIPVVVVNVWHGVHVSGHVTLWFGLRSRIVASLWRRNVALIGPRRIVPPLATSLLAPLGKKRKRRGQ
jgi:uncharacterized membrane protein